MKRTTLFSLCSALLASALVSVVAVGCGDDDNGVAGTPDGGNNNPDTGGGTDSGGNPTAPRLGAQIDRMGRPAINTAVNKTFTQDPVRGPAQDGYNANGTRSGWSTAYKDEIAANLAIYDGVDLNCGNQAFSNRDAGTTPQLVYSTLAGVLADDRLWLDTTAATCSQYLGVELNATGAVPNMDCGGRALSYDVIDTTYTAVGSTLAAPVTDGIAAVPAKTNGTTFPYLAAPL